MSDPKSKAELIEALQKIQQGVNDIIAGIPADQFDKSMDEGWSAAGYLKHLILSIKLVVKGMNLPPEGLKKMFGLSETPSRSYAEVVTAYKSRLEDGVRAEMFDRVDPAFYRFPEGVEDVQAYLVETWNDSNNRLIAALEAWDEDALDQYRLPHAAFPDPMTLREMIFFIIFHNDLHWRDIQAVAEQVAS
jgi:hypothetical protein